MFGIRLITSQRYNRKMQTLPRDHALEKWDHLWANMTSEFFKVEDLQNYSDEDNAKKGSLGAWLNGDKERALEIMRNEKNAWAQQTRANSARKIRIHVVDEPYTEYLKWELEHYKNINIPLGDEEVYLVNRTNVPDYNLGDFMMFDENAVSDSLYNESGYMVSMDFYENEPIDKFLAAKQLLMKHARRLEA
jgi:hypothetical protein